MPYTWEMSMPVGTPSILVSVVAAVLVLSVVAIIVFLLRR